MSSNKIGFLTALGLYAPIILCLALLDLKVNLVGKSGESKAFSIRLENIAGDFGAQSQKVQKKVVKKQYIRNSDRSAESKPRESRPTPSLQGKSKESPKQSNSESIADSNKDSHESTAKSSETSDSRGGVSSKAQESSGENDPYFLAITRIINKYHTREPVRNLYGVVGVAFSVNVSGEVEHLRVVSSSGSERLDNVALRTIRRSARSFPPPKRTYHIQTRLVYKRN